MTSLEKTMGRPKKQADYVLSGEQIEEALIRLGYAQTSVKISRVAELIEENTGKKVSRQRIANIISSRRVYPETVEMLAKGLGVDPSEFMKKGKGTK